MEESLRSIEEDNGFFEKMANLVPPNIYFDEETRLQLTGQKSLVVEEEQEEEVAVDSSPTKKKKKKKHKGKEEVSDEAAPPEQVQKEVEDGVAYDYRKLYVKGLQTSITKESLAEMFPAAIKIDLRKKKEKEKHKLRTSIIFFESAEAAKLALNAHQGRIYQVMYSRIRNGANTESTQGKKRKTEAPDTNLFKTKKQKMGQNQDKKVKGKVDTKVTDKPLHLKTVTEIQEALYTKDNEINHKKEMKAKQRENQKTHSMSSPSVPARSKFTAAVDTRAIEKLSMNESAESEEESDTVYKKDLKVMSKKEMKKQRKLESRRIESMETSDVKENGDTEMEEQYTSIKGKSNAAAEKALKPSKPKVSTPTGPLSPKPADSVSPKPSTPVSQSSVPDLTVPSGVPTVSDNRAKLHAKIEELQAKRKVHDAERQQKLMKRREKKQQQKLLKKQKKKEEKKSGNSEGASVKVDSEVVTEKKPQVKQILNKDGQMVFSKFDFSQSAKKDKKKGASLTGKDYKTLLGKIEKRNEKINSLKSKDESAGKVLEDKFKWDAAISKAEGVKVKDNPEVLKKALRKKEKMKEAKKKKWDSRTDHTKKMQDAKQAKRNKHIEERKQANKDKKMKILKKRGRMIPGF